MPVLQYKSPSRRIIISSCIDPISIGCHNKRYLHKPFQGCSVVSSHFSTTTKTNENTENNTNTSTCSQQDVNVKVEPMDKRLLFQYLQLKEFTDGELCGAFDRIYRSLQHDNNSQKTSIKAQPPSSHSSETYDRFSSPRITEEHMTSFFLERIQEIDAKQEKLYSSNSSGSYGEMNIDETTSNHDNDFDTDVTFDVYKQEQMKSFAQLESQRAMKLLMGKDIGLSGESGLSASGNGIENSIIMKTDFTKKIEALATDIDVSGTIPISASMLPVGSSVGIIIPVMPYVVSNLGLTTGQFGMVVSSFAFAKLFANVPAAVLVERHGRKPFLVYSLVIISMGVGGIGLASQFEHLVVCRTLTGIGVSLLSTAATLSIADCSTPLNRARTMAPMMSAFSAGTALGPAVGGILADRIGINSTFYLVGGMYLAVTALNKIFLNETKITPEKERVFPWQESSAGRKRRRRRYRKKKDEDILTSIQSAVSQWQPLLANPKVRNVVMMNGFYWVALSGAQMTLLPLILTDPSGLAMSPTNVGEIYMGMSLVQVFGNPTMAKFVDKMGKVPGIVTGCSLLSASMFALPYCADMQEVAATLGFWALGSTMLSTAPTAYISDSVDEQHRAQAIALLRTAGDIGFLFGASSTGAVADLFSMDVAVQSSASLLLTATGWFTARRWLDRQQTKQL